MKIPFRVSKVLVVSFALLPGILAGILAGTSEVLAAEKPATHTIVIEAMKFVPEVLEVKSGDTVIWVNKDYFPHTATTKEKNFDSREIAADASWKFVARKKGSFPYVCSLHPTMKATLNVK